MASFYSCGYRGYSCGSLEPTFATKLFHFYEEFKQNQHKLSNNHVQFSNRNLLCTFEPPSKKSWIRPCFYHLFYLHGPAHMGPIWNPVALPIWVPYRLLAEFMLANETWHLMWIGSSIQNKIVIYIVSLTVADEKYKKNNNFLLLLSFYVHASESSSETCNVVFSNPKLIPSTVPFLVFPKMDLY